MLKDDELEPADVGGPLPIHDGIDIIIDEIERAAHASEQKRLAASFTTRLTQISK